MKIYKYKDKILLKAESGNPPKRAKIDVFCDQCKQWRPKINMLCVDRSLKRWDKYLCRICTQKNSRPLAIANAKKTNLERYGFEVPSKSQIVKDKVKRTCLERYGVESTNKLESVKKKKIVSMQRKYGVDNPFQLEEVKKNIDYKGRIDKANKAFFDKYGVTNPSKLGWVKKKQKANSNMRSDLLERNGYKSYNALCDAVIAFMELHKVPAYNDKLSENFANISGGTVLAMLRYRDRRDLLYNGFYHSQYEEQIYSFIESLDLGHTILNSDRKAIKPKELDVYIPDLKFAIEFHGLYWHSIPIIKTKKAHINKRQQCEAQGINLLQFYSNEWIKKTDICKSIIKAHLNLFDEKHFARKLQIKKVDSNQRSTFLNNNHLMGDFKSGKSIGLFDGAELISLITYKKYKEGIDISRFCSRLNTQVVGGVSRLLKYIERNENPKFLQSFVDLRYPKVVFSKVKPKVFKPLPL